MDTELPLVESRGNEYIAPTNEIEETITLIWQEILNIQCVGRCEDFFELGGDSLLALQVIARLRAVFHVPLSLTDLFVATRVVEVAEIVLHRLLEYADSAELEHLLMDLERE